MSCQQRLNTFLRIDCIYYVRRSFFKLFRIVSGGSATVDELGIEIDSHDIEIAVLVCNNEVDTADCYTAMPTDITGTEYYTVSVPSANDASEFMIIAEEDATTVDITIPVNLGQSVDYNGATTNAGGTFQVSLNKGQTFCLAQTTSNSDTSHVTGYHITSDKAVSVISGNRKYDTDHVVDQMPPISKLGLSYVLIPADPVGDDRTTTYLIQAVEAGKHTLTTKLNMLMENLSSFTWRVTNDAFMQN